MASEKWRGKEAASDMRRGKEKMATEESPRVGRERRDPVGFMADARRTEQQASLPATIRLFVLLILVCMKFHFNDCL